MTSDRPYSEKRHPDEALAELERCAGTQFDARVVDALQRVLSGRRSADLLTHAA
jgi:HD-GYP domain-containing protein (c-di-GMP phosphodiesterase class II)